MGDASSVGRIVIVGAGQAGGEAAQRLRAGGFRGDLTVIGEERLPPYQRPPLSKKYLAGELEADRLLLRPAQAYQAEDVRLLTSRRANWIDRARKRVQLEGGQELPYDALILATGAKARKLAIPGADLPGVFTLRTAADADAMRPFFAPGARLVVIGAGYIGLEVAAVARQRGLDVTVVESAVRPLARVTCPEVSGFFLEQHVAHGVKFRLNAQAAVIKGADKVRAVQLTDATELAADLVLVGVGAVPETALAEKSGLPVQDGVLVDRAMRTADPAIWAIGDCVRRPLPHYEMRTARLESVHNAVEGAKIAAASILGLEPPAEEAPWFWSDQYDLKLTIAGLFEGYDALVLRGSMAERSFCAFYLKGGRVLAADAVNRPADYLAAKQLIRMKAAVQPGLLSDLSVSMKDVIAAAQAAA